MWLKKVSKNSTPNDELLKSNVRLKTEKIILGVTSGSQLFCRSFPNLIDFIANGNVV